MLTDTNTAAQHPSRSAVPMEPMDTYLCVLLKLGLIHSPGSYTQQGICQTIAENEGAFDQIYGNPVARQEAVIEFLDQTRYIDVMDKEGDCGKDY